MVLKRQNGSAAVEFAIILPILIVLLFGIVEFGLIFYNKAVITNASREGARYGIVFRDAGEEITCTDITGVINAYTSGKLVTFGSAAGVDIEYTPSNCTPVAGTDLTVRVSYQYDYLLLPNFVGGLAGPVNLTGQTTMVKE
jgi:Flp pilus assembly protein TadG